MTRARPLLALILMLGVLGVAAQDSGDELVIVASAQARFDSILRSDVRRLYLGARATENPDLQPVLNNSSADLLADFVREFLFMTEAHYVRQMAARRYRDGSAPILEVGSLSHLQKQLAQAPEHIGFAYRSDLAASPGLKVVELR